MDEVTETLIPGQAPEEGEEKNVLVDPKVFVCSFPKSGTHLVEQLVQPFVRPMPADRPWSGTFKGHSWTLNRLPIKRQLQRIGWIRDGTYAKGHMAYSETLENFFWGTGTAVIFIYRDPRDVAVSLTHHILGDNPHGRNEWYKEIGFDAALLGVIKGIGPYAGVMRRWNEYAGWLDVDWVLSMKYGDVLADKHQWCKEIVVYASTLLATHRGYNITIKEEELDRWAEFMVANSERTERSPTFRKGGSGGWRDEFKTAHAVAFNDTDCEAAEAYGIDEPWLVKLGLEDDVMWWTDWIEDKDEEGEGEWLKSDQAEEQTSVK